jgi:hypothetical protein
MNILGPQAKIPDMIPALDKAWDAHHDAWLGFTAARQPLKDAVDNLEQMEKGIVAAWEAEKDAVSKENFGLEPKKDKDKIARARKPFLKSVNDTPLVRSSRASLRAIHRNMRFAMRASRPG